VEHSSEVRILYIGPLPPEVSGASAAGGIGTHCWELADNARRNHYNVFVLDQSSPSSSIGEVTLVNPGRETRTTRLLKGLKFLFTVGRQETEWLADLSLKDRIGVAFRAELLQKMLASIRPDIIHVHSLHNLHTLGLRLLPSSVPVVITNHEFYPTGQSDHDVIVARQALSRADYLICTSEYTRNRLHEFGLCFEGKMKVIHKPLHPDRIPLLPKKAAKRKLGWEKKKTILFAGGYKPVGKKGLDILLRAVSADRRLADRCRVVVISSEEGQRWARRFENGKSGIDIQLLGFVALETMVNCYNAADVFVMPSRSEGFGLVYLESLLAGTPVIGFHRTLSEMKDVLEMYIGEIFDRQSEDEQALSEKINRVLDNPFDREGVCQKVAERFSWKVKFSEFQSVYEEVLRR